MSEDQSTGKNFFSTLPGIITAVAGLITAVGSFILILNKDKEDTGATSTEQYAATPEDAAADDQQTKGVSSVTYSPNRIIHSANSITYEIDGASAEILEESTVFRIKLRCINNRDDVYEFHSSYLEAEVNEKKYKVEPYQPSGESQSIPPKGSIALEFTIKLPAGTKEFPLSFWDGTILIDSATFTLE